MSQKVFEKREGETARAWILRLHLDPWFEDATPEELAAFTGLSPQLVRRTVMAWAKSTKVRRIHAHAQAVAEAIDWPGTPEGLVHLALERYAQRCGSRVIEPRLSLNQEIEDFLAKNLTKREAGLA